MINLNLKNLKQKLSILSLNISDLSSRIMNKFIITFLKVIFSLLLISYFILVIINLLNYYDLIDLSKYHIFKVTGNSGDGLNKIPVDFPTDVSRYWPSGVPQSFALLSTVYGTYLGLSKLAIYSPAQRMVATMASAGVSLTVMSYFAAVDNPVGFHNFLYLISQYKQTGKIPSQYEMRTGSNYAVENVTGAPSTISSSPSQLEKVIEDLKAFYSSSNNTEPLKPTPALEQFLLDNGYSKTTPSKEDWVNFKAETYVIAKKCIVQDPSDNDLTKSYSIEDYLKSSNEIPLINEGRTSDLLVYRDVVVAILNSSSCADATSSNTETVPNTKADTSVDIESSLSGNIGPGNNFLPEDSSLNDYVLNKFFKLFEMVMGHLKPVEVSGHLDDLIGQRIFIEFLLLVMCIFVTLLFTIFIINIIYFLNKDKIIKLFNNKYINMVIKYQNILIKLNLIYLPIFIGIGLFTILNGLIWLITHPIPYTSLDIDLHQFISSKI